MICPNCQTANDESNQFCYDCGATLRDVRQMPTIHEQSPFGAAQAQTIVSSPEESIPDPLVGRIIDGRYRLDARIGMGGMGAVYRGTRLMIGDAVAIKILHPEQVKQSQAAERFRREAQSAARLKHPNAVAVYDFGVSTDGLFYLVMELVEGESLRQVIRQRGPLSPLGAAEIITQVCAALDEAHRQGVVHRDIKPDNIMVHSAIGGLRVKVLDFGIAKLRDKTVNSLTQAGSVVGTPHYMSPEQCSGEEVDSRSDIYSLGVVLYEVLAGALPFNSPTPTAVAIQHVNHAPPPLRGANASIPATVETVVLHALEKRREMRPQTAGALARELNAAISGVSFNQTMTATTPPPTPVATQPPSYMKTMVVNTPPSGSQPPVLPYGVSTPSGYGISTPSGEVAPARRKSSRWPIMLVAAISIALIGGLAYYFLLYQNNQQAEALPDHFGIFARDKDALKELQRRETSNVLNERDAILKDSSLPVVGPKPTLILYAEPQDIPTSDLKLVQLDTIDTSGNVRYWNYQVSPVEGRRGMRQIRIAGGLRSGKYAFALFNGFMEDGKHRLWPFQVAEGAPEPTETPQVAKLQVKPTASPSPTATPTATPTPQSTPSPTPSGTPAGGTPAYCNSDNVVLRASPDLNGPKIGRLSRGQRLYILEVSNNYDTWKGITSNWSYVQPEGSSQRGWVFTYFISR